MTGQRANDAGALPKAVGLSAAGLVDYAQGAVVSRTIVKTHAGTITLFAFDAGEELSEHSAPFDAFVHVLDGEVVLTIGGKEVLARQGELVVMPANVPHAVRADVRFKMMLVMLRSVTG